MDDQSGDPPADDEQNGTTQVLVGDEWRIVSALTPSDATSVWHYTDAAGLIGILSSHTIWASSTLALNDTSEVRHGLSVVSDAWREHSRTGVSDAKAAAFDGISARAQARLATEFFVLSTTRNSDSLNQWQGYAGVQGYAIELKVDSTLSYLLNGDDNPPFTIAGTGWLDVIYDDGKKSASAHELLDLLLDMVPEPGQPRFEHFLHDAAGMIASLAVQLKDAAFSGEEEVRFVYPKPSHLRERFRHGRRGVLPYISLASAEESASYAESSSVPLPILGVVCGPSGLPEDPQLEAIVKRLQRTQGYVERVSFSKVPYRF